MATTRADLEQLVRILNNRVPSRTHYYELEYAYGRPRLVQTERKRLTSRDISPRLPAGQLRMWLSAFLDGMDECRHRRR